MNSIKDVLVVRICSLKNHLDAGAFEVPVDPGVPFLQLFSAEVVLPVTDLTFSEELLHGLAHFLVFSKHGLTAMLAQVANVEMVIKCENLNDVQCCLKATIPIFLVLCKMQYFIPTTKSGP